MIGEVILYASLIVIVFQLLVMVFKMRFESGSAQTQVLSRFVGAVMFGGVTIFFAPQKVELLTVFDTHIFYNYRLIILLVVLMGVIVVINNHLSLTQKHQDRYPEIREKEWSFSLLLVSSFSWIIYLINYEYLFRGYLFFNCLEEFGFWGATIVNAILYSLSHLPKGKFESIGAFPLGILFCYLTYLSGSVWIVIILHCTIALSNEFLSLAHNKSIVLKF